MAPLADRARLRRLLDSVMSLGSELDLPSTLHRMVATAVDLTGATHGAFGVLDATGSALDDWITFGIDEDDRAALGAPPTGKGVLGLLIERPEPTRIARISEHPDGVGFPAGHPDMTSFLGVPVRVRQRVYGFLYLTDKQPGGEFDEVDEQLAVSLARAAGLAIENASMRERFAEVVLLEERERIARELHDVVIQRIYGVGLNLQTAIRQSDDEELRSRLESAVSDLDETIDDIRSTIYELHAGRPARASLREAVADLVEEYSRVLGFTPRVDLGAPVDDAVSAATAEHLVMVVREALSNVARHARASAVTLHIDVVGDHVVLVVVDDGVGPPADLPADATTDELAGRASGQGLRNIAARAEKLGGTSSFTAGPTGGSVLRWTVPLHWAY